MLPLRPVYIRRNTFNSKPVSAAGIPINSLADYFMINAEGNYPEDLDAFYERLALTHISSIPYRAFRLTIRPPYLLPIDQTKTIDIKGGVGEWTILPLA